MHCSQIIHNLWQENRAPKKKKRLIPIRHQQHILAQNDQVISAELLNLNASSKLVTWYHDSHGINGDHPHIRFDTPRTDYGHGKLAALQRYRQPQHVL